MFNFIKIFTGLFKGFPFWFGADKLHNGDFQTDKVWRRSTDDTHKTVWNNMN